MTSQRAHSKHADQSRIERSRPTRDPAAVAETIQCRADDLCRTELERALRRFEAAGECSPEQQAIIEAMATAIVEGVLATPTAVLESAPADDPALQTTIDLFDPSE